MTEVAKKKDTRTRVRTSKLCVYCCKREAHTLVQLPGGTSNGAPSKRWMCGMCILKRQRLGILNQGTNQLKRVK